MFIPKPYRQNDQQKLLTFMRAYPFATIVTGGGSNPLATHLPFIVERENDEVKLVSHMALANPQWKALRDQEEVLVIFQGPHAYITPAFYNTPLGVPTWNYASVHAYGTPVIRSGTEGVVQTLLKTISAFEPGYQTQWENIPSEYAGKLMGELVAFEIRVTSLEGAFKLSQDKTVAVQERIASWLEQDSDSVIAAVGGMMRENLQQMDEEAEQ
ncbi:FMN-binding negative transcriptional regulator [Brevibacillus fluminis]|uniref:FMN-binding negative transcriptional regulator n=1 Tax=Brevibacillus fluminis TaxID=511487 RepID=A0A3M8CZH2_9BACL|nr:FMN-binding negative transcriptional regulator [Brevibacillus fluminis]RNB81242.1 FMN-binding negative transcriptional regulator [Brevibacillus fluminis]